MSAVPAPELVKVTIDGKTVSVPKGTLLVDAAAQAGIEIPVFCYHPKLEPAGVCRMCLVEVEGQRKPVTACTMPVSDGMVCKTESPVVDSLRKSVLELLLLNHPLDCPVCDKGGECDLQDLTYGYGPATSRLADPKLRRRKAADLGPFIVFDEERCILCRRCVRFDDEIAQERTLVVEERAHDATITTGGGIPYDSYFSGNTIELCPVGALTSRLYRFKSRPWDLVRVPSVCTGCSVGCNVSLHFRHGNLVRVVARDNAEVDGGWLCDRGRFNYQYIHDENRIERPLVRKDGQLVETSWAEAIEYTAKRFREIVQQHGPGSIGLVGGGRLSNEEAYFFQRLGRAALQTPHVDHRVTEQLLTSVGRYPGRPDDVENAKVILLVDVLVGEVAPVLDLRVRRAGARRGARVINLGPVLQPYHFRHIAAAVAPGSTAAALHQLAEAVQAGANGNVSVGNGTTQAAQALSPELCAQIAQALQGDGKLAVIWSGEGAEEGQALLRLLGALGRGDQQRAMHLLIPGEQANSRGAEYMGVTPGFLPGYQPITDGAARKRAEQVWGTKIPATAGMDTQRMLEAAAMGQLTALYLVSANITHTFPNGDLVAKALDTVPFLVVQDLFLTETAKRADVVFPAAPFTAKVGSWTALDGLIQEIPEEATRPGADSRTDLDIFYILSQALGVSNLPKDGASLRAEISRLVGPVTAGNVLDGAPAHYVSAALGKASADVSVTTDSSSVQALRVVAIPRLHAGGGTAEHDVHFRDAAQIKPEAVLHPQDADAMGIKPGDRVEISVGDAACVFTAKVAKLGVPGTVAIYRGLTEAPANRLVGAERYPLAKVVKRVLEQAV